MELAPLTVLNKKYSVKRTLGDPGPFDIRYLGQDVDSKAAFVIREYFPVDIAARESGKTSIEVTGGEEAEALFESGLGYFQKESEVLAGLQHEALPSELDVFQANGTCYRVRPNGNSMPLSKGLASKGPLSEKSALTIMVPILEALHVAHEAGLYHGGVSPETIRLAEEGNVLLTGFRGAQIQVARSADKLDQVRQPGYSAIEQYTPRANQGPWTDVYAAAATICTMVTGEPIPEASERLEGEDPLHELLEDADVSFSPGVREALIEALVIDPSKRLQSVDALRNALEESSERYDGTEASYAIMPVESDEETAPSASGEREGDDEEIEVLTTASGDRPARAQRKPEEKSSLSTVLLVGLPLLLIGIGGGLWFASGNSEAPGSAYADYRAQADSLYGEGEYNEAEGFYNQALQVRPEDEYVLDQLRSISEQQEESEESRYVEQVERGEELFERAANFQENDNYEEANSLYGQALAAYYNAVDLSPDSERTAEAEDRIAAIQEQQRAMLRERSEGGGEGEQFGPDQFYDFFISEAERQFGAGNLRAARGNYEDALEYRSGDPYARRRIQTIDNRLQAQSSQDEFQDLLDRAERLMQTSNYTDAQDALEQAVQINPDDPEVQEMISENEELLAEQQQQQERFSALREQADNALQQENYEQAISLYRQAYEINPDSDEVVERLQQAQRQYEELQMAEQRRQREDQRSEEDETTGERIYTVVDQDAAPVGGLGALTQNASYPERAARRGIEGRVYVQAVVNADGGVREAELVRGIGYGCDREALRVVREAEFEPAQVSGRTVASRTTVWVQFSLDR